MLIFLPPIERHFAFNERIIPWSMVCVTDVVLGGRQINSTHSRCLTCRWALQLSMIYAIFCLSLPNFRSSSQTHSSNSSDDIQLFNWDGIDKANVLLLWITLVSATFQWQKSAAFPQKQYQHLAQLNALYCVFHQSIFDPYNAWFYWGSFDKISQ